MARGEAVAPLAVCPRCSRVHVTRFGAPSCRAHLARARSPEGGGLIPCTLAPVRGTPTCQIHGSGSKQAQAGGKKKLALAEMRDTLEALGGQIDVDPTEAMLVMVREAAFNVAFYRGLVRQLKPAVEGDDDTRPVIIDEDGVAQVHPAWVGAGIAGRVSPSDWKVEPHVIVRLYNQERDRLMKYAKMCRDAGVQERQVQLQEEQGRWLVQTVDLVLEQLGLTQAQQEQLPAIMGRVIEQLEAGS